MLILLAHGCTIVLARIIDGIIDGNSSKCVTFIDHASRPSLCPEQYPGGCSRWWPAAKRVRDDPPPSWEVPRVPSEPIGFSGLTSGLSVPSKMLSRMRPDIVGVPQVEEPVGKAEPVARRTLY